MSQEPTKEIASFISSLEAEDIPDDLKAFVKRRFVDTVGVLVAGSTKEPGATVQEQFFKDPFSRSKSSLAIAERGFVLGTSGHCLDFDDSTHSTHAHVSVTVIPTIVALANSRVVSGIEAFEAYIAGFETAHYLAEYLMEEHYTMGWHGTGTVGVFAACGTAAKLMDLRANDIENALCMAASFPAGLRGNFGSMTKPLHAGSAVRSGLTAVLQTSAGITANQNVLTGKHGFFDVYAPGVEWSSRQPKTLGSTWGALEEGANTKLYPCCHEIHAGLEATVSLATDHDLKIEDIKEINVTATPLVTSNTNIRNPNNPAEAKFSMTYVIAAALIDGEVTLTTFTDNRITDQGITELESRIKLETDPERPTSYSTTVEIVRTDGSRYSCTKHNPPGINSPVTEKQLREKFEMCTSHLAESDRDELYELLRNLTERNEISLLEKYCYSHP